MNIDYELYRIFYYVVQHKTISKAAEYLYISQPAVSQSIHNLEDKLGGKLFIRTKKGIVLTDEGKVLYDYVKGGIDSFTKGENAFLNFKNLDSGSIRIGASTTVTRNVVMPYIEEFHKNYPNVDIKITNNLTNELVNLLRSGELDLLVVNLPMKEHKDLTIIPICDVQDIFVGNLEYYNITKGKLNINELSNYPLVFQQAPSNTREFLDNYFKTNNVNIKPQNEIVSYNLVMDFVKAGFGIGYATKDFILDDLNNKRLFEIKMEPKVPKRSIGIVLINKAIPNYSASKLIDIMKKDN
jgi:Transcriptional regulator